MTRWLRNKFYHYSPNKYHCFLLLLFVCLFFHSGTFFHIPWRFVNVNINRDFTQTGRQRQRKNVLKKIGSHKLYYVVSNL